MLSIVISQSTGHTAHLQQIGL